MKCSRPFLTGAIAAFALIAACGEQPSDIQPADSDSELLAHTPHTALAAAVLALLPDYTTLDAAAASGTGGSLHLAVNAGGDVPRFPDAFINSVPVFGYAWVDLATGVGVVATIHPLIGRDSNQNPRAWHAHQVQLSAGAAFDFCIASLGTSQGGLTIQADELGLNLALHQAGVSAGALDVAAAFVVQPDAGCAATGLGVDVLDTESL